VLSFVLAISAMSWACVRIGTYACTKDDNCVRNAKQGICQPTGWCSYEDPTCSSGHRYDDLAGAGLEGACVHDEGSTSSASATDPTSADDVDDGDTECEPIPVEDCVDLDGDGHGVGSDCLGPDCDDDNPARFEGCLHLSPNGDDSNPGTEDAPWGTLTHALGQLEPGDSLLLHDGEYRASTTGRFQVDCASGHASATADLPISVRALNERQAYLFADGSTPALSMRNCGHWNLTGLAGRSEDRSGDDGGSHAHTVDIRSSHDVRLRRLLFSHNNRWFNTHLYHLRYIERLLVEECEAYWFHRNGYAIIDSSSVTLRRCHAHARGHGDLPGCSSDASTPYCSSSSSRGDAAFSLSSVQGGIVENSVAEGCTSAFYFGGDSTSSLFTTSVGIGGALRYGANSAEILAGDNRAEHLLLLNAPGNGVQLESPREAVIERLTVLMPGADGVRAWDPGDACGVYPNGCSFLASHLLVVDASDHVVRVADIEDWSVVYSNLTGALPVSPDEDIDDAAGHVRHSLSMAVPEIGLGEGQCAIALPEGSAVAHVGEHGGPLGAEVLHRVIDGVATDDPLWDPITGAFACGAVRAGINDLAGASCGDLHERANVRSEACRLPRPPGSCGP
jgi:hypothetical protein